MQSYNITGLAPYQLVTVTITATNGGGTSENSNEMTARTSEAGIIIVYFIYVSNMHAVYVGYELA